MTLTLEEREAERIYRRGKARERKAAKAARPARVIPVAKGQREPRQRDPAYLAWLHEGLPCIACLIEGQALQADKLIMAGPRHGEWPPYPIEAAHQKHTDLKGPALGKRPSDAASCPLCAWHHRLAPDACDPAQRKFWDRLGVDVGMFCRALYDAFKTGHDGAVVIRQFARRRR